LKVRPERPVLVHLLLEQLVALSLELVLPWQHQMRYFLYLRQRPQRPQHHRHHPQHHRPHPVLVPHLLLVAPRLLLVAPHLPPHHPHHPRRLHLLHLLQE
jgi:hypothetical protein